MKQVTKFVIPQPSFLPYNKDDDYDYDDADIAIQCEFLALQLPNCITGLKKTRYTHQAIGASTL